MSILVTASVAGTTTLVYLGTTSTYLIDPDKMLLVVRMGSYRGVYLSQDTYEEFQRDRVPTPRSTDYPFFDLAILPWPIWRGVYLPLGTVELNYHGTQIYTSNNVPFRLNVSISFKLNTDLSGFIKTFNVFGAGRNLAEEDDIHYFFKRDPETGVDITKQYRGPCLAQILIDSTTAVVQDALRRAAARFTFEQLKGDLTDFEGWVRYYLAEPRSQFAQARILQQIPGREGEAATGTAIQPDTFNVNFSEFQSEDPEYQKELTAPERGRLKGEGERNRLRAMAKIAATDGGKEVMRNETLRQIDEVTVVAAPDGLQASLERLLRR